MTEDGEKLVSEADDLRHRAEGLLRKDARSSPPGDPQKLVHELQVHQIELEMQNEELRDVRTQLEAALERYTDLFEFAPFGYLTFDDRGVISTLNLTAAGLLRTERSGLIGRRFDQLVPVAQRAALQDVLGRAITSCTKESFEVMLPDDLDQFRTLLLQTLFCSMGRECRVVILDITERKRMEAEVLRLHQQLERRAAELEAANQELEAFSYTVSHDLRKPLTIINGYCQLIGSEGGLSEECQGFLKAIEQGVSSMDDLIDTLLEFSRMTPSDLRPEPVDLSGMAQVIVAGLSQEQPERRVTFSIAAEVSCHCDAKLMRIALLNLLGNAWKYTQHKKDAVIEFGIVEGGGGKACFVRDNGTGFDIAHGDRLFKAFQRLPGSELFTGLGIGLATVQRIIQLHGGRIWAESEVGKGATFYFSLC